MSNFSIQNNGMTPAIHSYRESSLPQKSQGEQTHSKDIQADAPQHNSQGSWVAENQKYSDQKERDKLKEDADKLFESLNMGIALKFHERSNQWYAVIENKVTHEVIKEVPPKEVLELRARLKEMIGFFLDKKI